MKNYKGFEKRPYCNAHCPQAKATTVADTPEIRRLAENTRIQSQAKYHEDFEKSKGKNFTTIADDPETRRVKETSKIISNASYHGDVERKKHMEDKRNIGGQDELPLSRISSNTSVLTNNNNSTSNNNNIKHQNRIQSSNNNHSQNYDHHELTTNQHAQQQYQQRLLQQQQKQQQALIKQQKQYVQPVMNRQSSAHLENHHQQSATRHVQQQNPYQNNQHQQMQMLHHHQQQQHHHQQQQQQQQQQMLMQHQQQQILMQQHRQSMDASIPMSRQVSKQSIINNVEHPMMKNLNMTRGQQSQQLKYMHVNDNLSGQQVPQHLVGVPHQMMSPANGGMPAQNRRPGSHPSGPPQAQIGHAHHAMMQNYHPNQIDALNGIMPKQHHPQMANIQPLPHMVSHPDQVHPQQRMQMCPATMGGQAAQMSHQVPRRVFRAMYDYVANDVDEVSFLENDILVDCVNVDRNWLVGKVARSGQTGMLPANYVELLPSQ